MRRLAQDLYELVAMLAVGCGVVFTCCAIAGIGLGVVSVFFHAARAALGVGG